MEVLVLLIVLVLLNYILQFKLNIDNLLSKIISGHNNKNFFSCLRIIKI